MALIALAALLPLLPSQADIYWTNTAGGYWDESSNWTGSGGNWIVRHDELNATPVTILFRNAESISTGLWLCNLMDGLVTLRGESDAAGLTLTGSAHAHVGNATYGAAAVDGGTFHFSNDLIVGDGANAKGKFTLKSGRVETQYWMPIATGNNAVGDVAVEDGELVIGYRDGAEVNNGCLVVGSGSSSTATFTQTGGTVRSSGSTNNDASLYAAMLIAHGSGATGTVTFKEGADYTADGDINVASGNNATGTLNIEGGTVTIPNGHYLKIGGHETSKVAQASGTTSTVNISGGAVRVDGVIIAGHGVDSQSTLNISGDDTTISVGRYMTVAYASGTEAEVNISGGSMALGEGFLIGDNGGKSATVNVTGGRMTASQDSYVGWTTPGTLTISGDGYVAVGAATNHKWLKLNNSDSVTGTSRINLNDGGTLDICSIQLVKSAGTGEVNFNGGVLRAYANNSHSSGRIIQSNDQLFVYLKEKGGTVEVPSGVSVSIAEPLLTGVTEEGATDGGLTKTGEGTLTLTTGNTYTGATRIEAGTLSVPSGESIDLDLAGGTLAGEATVRSVTVSGGAYAYDALPPTTANAYAVTGGVVTATLGETTLALPTNTTVSADGVFALDVSGLADFGNGSSVTVSGLTLEGTGKVALTSGGAVLRSTTEAVERGYKVTLGDASLTYVGGDWTAEGAWKGTTSGTAYTFADGDAVVFAGTGEAATNDVSIASAVAPGTMASTSVAGRAYRLTGAAVETTTLDQSGEGALILANEGLTASGAVTVSAGELVLEGATLTADSLANNATLRASGAATSTLAAAPSGTGTIAIDEGATLATAATSFESATPTVVGAGVIKPLAGTTTVGDCNMFDGFKGSIRVESGVTLNLASSLHDSEDYILGKNSTLIMAGGTIGKFARRNGTNNEWLDEGLVFEDGTTSVLNNRECRQANEGCRLHINSDISGEGKATFYATARNDWHTTLSGDNAGFKGEMTLSGRIFDFTTATAGSAEATWNFVTANTLHLSHAAGSTIQFGAFNVTQSGAHVNVANAGAIVEVGAKGDSTMEGAFTGAEFTLKKVGEGTTLTLNGDSSATANVVVEAGAVAGTGTVKSLAVEAGAEVDFGDLSDTSAVYTGLKSLSVPVIADKNAVKGGAAGNGRWVLTYTSETVTPDEGDPYTVYTLCAEFRKSGLLIIVR